MEKIEFSHHFWKNDDTQLIADLIGKLWEEKDNDNIILDIDDLVRENDERTPVLYGIIPYIVEIAVNKEAEEAIKIWTYLGCWVYNQNLYRTGVETCVLLSRKNGVNKSTRIEIEIDLNEADKRECVGRATYQEIKNYILEHYQTKVSSLYIAQIKRKLGIIERENYNLPKTDNGKVLICPSEKEEMIKEALKYFGMLNRE